MTMFAAHTKIKGLVLVLSAQQFFNFAGSSSKPNRNFMILGPVVNKILKKGYFVSFNPNITLDWANSNYSVPLAVSLGKAFARNLSAFVAPQYMLSGSGKL